MLYFDINGYEGFKELFGQRADADGKMIRKNKILLGVWKDMFSRKGTCAWSRMYADKSVRQPLSQAELEAAGSVLPSRGRKWRNEVAGYELPSDEYEVIDGGICEDGDINAVRYRRDGRVYKMKSGKFYTKIYTGLGLQSEYGERMMRYCAERFAIAWSEYAEQNSPMSYELRTGKDYEDFERIYSSSPVGSFGSCMTNNGFSGFYVDCVDATAAWLEDGDGDMVARCVIFDDVRLDDGRSVRVAERQYAADESDRLKQILVGKLYKAGLIDMHKRVGASCHDCTDFKWEDGTAYNGDMSIRCSIGPGDEVSYQDTFKFYDADEYRAYNYDNDNGCYDLCVTGGQVEGVTYNAAYDDFQEENVDCDPEDMVYCHWRSSVGNECEGNVEPYYANDHFTEVDAGERAGERWHKDDVVYVHEDCYFIGDPCVVMCANGGYTTDDYCVHDEDTGGDMDEDDCVEWNGKWYSKYECMDVQADLGRSISAPAFRCVHGVLVRSVVYAPTYRLVPSVFRQAYREWLNAIRERENARRSVIYKRETA